MADHKFQVLALLTFYLSLAFCQNPGTTTKEASVESIVSVKCCPSGGTSTTELGENFSCANSRISIKWKILDSYKIPKVNSGILETDTAVRAEFDKSSLNCDSTAIVNVPVWKDAQNYSSKGYFSSFHADGNFQYDKHLFKQDEFCIQRITLKAITVAVCNYTSFCNDATCMSRCCDYGQVWDISGKLRCADSGRLKWKPEISEEATSGNKLVIITTHPRDLIRNDCATRNFSFHSSHLMIQGDESQRRKFGRRPFKVFQDGTVWMKLRKFEWIQLEPGEYCIDGFQFGEGTFSGNSDEAILFECKLLETPKEMKVKEVGRWYSLIFGIILSFCLIFLLVTTIVYILLWSKHNIHGLTVFCYIVTLLVSYSLFGISHFTNNSLYRRGGKYGSANIVTFCGIIGILCHFSVLAIFSWSTVLNFDLWCTFRNLRPTSGKSSGWKRFVLYCLFALAIPTAIVGVGIFLDVKYRNEVLSDVVSPQYGNAVCYVEQRYARLDFVIIPIAILLGVNLLLFSNTAYAVYKVKKATRFASSNSTRSEADNQTFRLILKLLLVNGTVWIAEIISWHFQTDYEEVGVVSFILDVVNVLQALAIFFIFVFKNDILESLKRSYPCLEVIVNAAFKLKRSVCCKPRAAKPSNSSSSCQSKRTTESNLAVTKC